MTEGDASARRILAPGQGRFRDVRPPVAIGLIVLLAAVTFGGLMSDALAHEARLVDEFAAIATPPGAVVISAPRGLAKPFLASYGAQYRTTLQADGIFSFYARELERLGWQDAGSRKLGDVTTKCWDKGEFWAAVEPSLEVLGVYALDLSWGRGVCDDAN